VPGWNSAATAANARSCCPDTDSPTHSSSELRRRWGRRWCPESSALDHLAESDANRRRFTGSESVYHWGEFYEFVNRDLQRDFTQQLVAEPDSAPGCAWTERCRRHGTVPGRGVKPRSGWRFFNGGKLRHCDRHSDRVLYPEPERDHRADYPQHTVVDADPVERVVDAR